MSGIPGQIGQWNLMRSPRTLGLQTVDFKRAGPTLGGTQDDDGPDRAFVETAKAGGGLDPPYFLNHQIERPGHPLVNLFRIVSFDEVRVVAVAPEQRHQFLARDSRQDGRARDLVAVQMEDRQNRAVAHRIQELVRVPACGERSRLCLSITHHAGHQQILVVERRTVSSPPSLIEPGVSGAT